MIEKGEARDRDEAKRNRGTRAHAYLYDYIKEKARDRNEAIFLFMFHNVFYIAVQYFAKSINGMGAYAFISFEPRYLRRANVVFFYKSILCYSFGFHCFPQFFISNHI